MRNLSSLKAPRHLSIKLNKASLTVSFVNNLTITLKSYIKRL
jgi:hypothetical protein